MKHALSKAYIHEYMAYLLFHASSSGRTCQVGSLVVQQPEQGVTILRILVSNKLSPHGGLVRHKHAACVSAWSLQRRLEAWSCQALQYLLEGTPDLW